MIELINNFKPQLLPNEKSDETPDWESRLEAPQDWYSSVKYDGARIELEYGDYLKGRSLKVLPNKQLQRMNVEIQESIGAFSGIIEGEFYSEGMNFSEIMHFFKTEDVTSEKTKKKYLKLWQKTGGNPDKGWPYPGRSVEWLTTWHDSLKFYVFDRVINEPKAVRVSHLEEWKRDVLDDAPHLKVIQQVKLTSLDMMYQMYDQAILDGHEGLVLVHKNAPYKCGRHTLKSQMAYKVKDNQNMYDGVVTAVVEGTIAREGAEKTTNELGRSVTSKLKEDRLPSGMASGVKVRMDDGRELTVSLIGYDHPGRKTLLENPEKLVGESIKFKGMPPVKASGVPRHAMFTKGDIRDEK